jgi:hypothetical protein
LKLEGNILSRFEPNLAALNVKKWAQIHNKIQGVSPDQLPNDDAFKAELDRLDRATEFIFSTVESAHPFAEFINPDIQNHVTNFESRLGQLKSAQSNQLPNLVSQLNNEITTILDRLSPYLSNVDSARSAGQALGRYKRLVEKQEEEIRAIRATIDDALETIQKNKTDAASYRFELLEGTEEQPSIHADISEKTSQIDKMLSSTKNFYQSLTEGDSESASIENKIVQAQKNATKDSEEITEKLKAAERKLKELDRVHSEVMGSSEGDETQAKGLKAQLDDREVQLNEMADGFDKRFGGLLEQIEGLLPGATSAGLATAYNNRRVNAEKSAQLYSKAFFVGIVALAVSAAVTVTQTFSLWPFSWEFIRIENAKEYLDKILFKLPIVIPVLWATLTVSKRRSEMQRLAEEYAHKEALAQSYEGFKQQIVELGKEDDPLVRNLLEVILKAISINAAKTLEGKHGDKMPVQEIIEETIRKARNFPSPLN